MGLKEINSSKYSLIANAKRSLVILLSSLALATCGVLETKPDVVTATPTAADETDQGSRSQVAGKIIRIDDRKQDATRDGPSGAMDIAESSVLTQTPEPLPIAQPPVSEQSVAIANSAPIVDDDPGDLLEQLAPQFLWTEHANHADVQKWLRWLKKNPYHMRSMLRNAERYMYHVYDRVSRRGLPPELVLLPAVESNFDPFALSPGGATGLWQFMARTATSRGLDKNWWYDARRDVVESTDAALDYLGYLSRRFDDDWIVAIAAYNCGEGRVAKARKHNRKAGKPVDFWSLKLPAETRAYVPKLIAMALILQNPDDYDLPLWPIPNESYFSVVETTGPVDLAWAAAQVDVPVEEMLLLNAGLNTWSTPLNGPYRILVHSDVATKLRRALRTSEPADRASWQTHTIQPKDSLQSIAWRYDTEADILRALNALESEQLSVGTNLLVPRTQGHNSMNTALSVNRDRLKHNNPRSFYRVRSGDTLSEIAEQQGVSLAKLKTWNQLDANSVIRVGQKLTVYGARAAQLQVEKNDPSAQLRKQGYLVKAGDNLWDIARTYKLRVSDLARWNQLNKSSVLRPGQRLLLWPAGTSADIAMVAGVKTVHVVSAGDNLGSIGQQYAVSVAQLCEWNGLDPASYLRLGQKLVILRNGGSAGPSS